MLGVYSRAVTDPATSADTLYARAVEAANRGDFGRAEALMRDALASAPARADIRRDLARVLCALGRHAEAIAHFDDALSGEPPAQARDHYDQGTLLDQAGRADQAEAAYCRALELAPEWPLALDNLGVCLQQRGRFDEAEDAFRRALASAQATDHERAFTWRNLGSLLCQTGRVDQAVDVYRQALALDPDDATTHHELAKALHLAGDTVAAEAAYRRALSLEPENARAHCHLGDLLLAAERASEAEAAYTRALALDPDDPEALRGLGASVHVQKRFDEALLAFSAALERDPDNPRYHFHLGVLFDHMGHFEDAVNEYRATLALAPDDLQAQMNLAGLLYRMREWDSARTAYQRALELAPDDSVARYLCAVLGREALAGAPAGYVSHVFDGYADGYEEHMVEVLGYQVPGVIRSVLAAELGPAADQRRSLLDLGCGTGLVAEALADLVELADGVDLSAQMLERARARGRYRELFHDDIVAMLARRDLGLAHYDIIAAADVLIYIGDLQPVFAAARERLSATGVLVFSVEDSAGEPYEVHRTGRFAHSSAYIERLAADHGLSLRRRQPTVLRTESQAPVHGTVFVLGRQTA